MRRWFRTEDSWAVLTGFAVVLLGIAPLFGIQPLGWFPKVSEWTDIGNAVAPTRKGLPLPGWACILFAYLSLAITLGFGSWWMGLNWKRFLVGFTILFAASYSCWVLGHFAYFAATPDKLAKLNIQWSLGLTGEAGYLVALIAGLLIGNIAPSWAEKLREAGRTEWFIKTAIVVVGASYGVKAAEESGRAGEVLLRALAAILEAYLIYWAVVYFIARKLFKFSREWAAPLASGISICGVSAAITTGAAVRARPSVPVMVSSLVVIFSVVELLILPWVARTFLADEPMVAAAWMGLAVKTDGAAFSSGAITESMMYADAAQNGIHYKPGWMAMTTGTVKVFIDLFIGVWAVVLALVWAYGIDRKPGVGVPLKDIWGRFPKFVFGYVVSFVGLFLLAYFLMKPEVPKALKDGMEQADQVRRIFFAMTFFAIGLGANLRRLWKEGIAKLALVYAVSLFGFVIWFGLFISWIFFHGTKPPLEGP